MPRRVWTPERVTEDILELKKAGEDLRHGAVQEEHKRLVSAAIRYFGSWRAAIEAAGLDYEDLRRESEEQRLQKIGKWSEERILSEVRGLLERGEDLRAVVIKNKYPALFSAAVSPRYFGNWRKALTAAGVDYDQILARSPRGRPKRAEVWHASLILEKIRDMSREGVDLEPDRVAEKFPKLVRLATMRFGNWKNAVDRAIRGEQAAPPDK